MALPTSEAVVLRTEETSDAAMQPPSSGPSPEEMYEREMKDLRLMMQTALEQRGSLAKIKAEIRASIFEALEESDRSAGPGAPKVIVGTCSEQAKALNNTKAGKILGALVCEYMDWAGVDHSLHLFLAESNLTNVHPVRRANLALELGLPPSPAGKPLLLELVEQHFQHKAKEAPPGHSAAPASTGRSSARASSPTRGPSLRSSSPFGRGLSPFRGEQRDKSKSKTSANDTGRSSQATTASMLRDH